MDIPRDLRAPPLTDDYLLSDDIWKQFQIEEMQQFQTTTMQLQTLPPVLDITTCPMLCHLKNCKVEHDCMWNGHCRGGKHGKGMCNSKSAPPGDDDKTPVAQVAPSQQQSVLKSNLRMSVDPNSVVPMTISSLQYSIQTPPISDDEDTKPVIMTQTLQNLQSAIFENYIDDDDDLSDYFKGDDEDFGFFDEEIEEEEEEEEEDEDEEEREKQEKQMRAFHAAASDHSYHKGNNHSAMHSASLGIDTPSDSEEEIDVVSLGDKFSITKAVAAGAALPNNPSTKDRRQLQRTMQSRFPQGIKTIMPVRRASSSTAAGPSNYQQQKTKTETGRAGRPRQYKRVNQNHRQYKRRSMYGHSSDSEPEPSEKRNLHNNMERQRRIDLRNLFNDLKKLVPEVNKKQRAAKVLILRGAAQYCRDLTGTNEVLERRVDFLKKQQQRFRARLSQLRRDFAAKR